VSSAVTFSPAGAQPSAKEMHRIGFLSVSDALSSSANRGAFVDGMRQFGYQESKDYSIEPRYAEGKLDRLPTLAAELVELKVDVIVLGSIPCALAAQKATKNIPIVVCRSRGLRREWSRGKLGAARVEYHRA
jgi:putative ABC transport system substrate-binding protein